MRVVRGRLLSLLCVGLALGAAAIGAGCGSSDDASGSKPAFSAAEEPPEAFVNRVANLLATTKKAKDCVELAAINDRSAYKLPCPSPKHLRGSMSHFKLVDAKAYGTGAIVDYKSGDAKQGATIVLAVAPDRRWGMSRFGIVTPRSVGTSDDDSRDGFDKTVDGFLEAVRDRNCHAYATRTVTKSDDEKTTCQNEFPPTKSLAKLLKDNPSSKPEYEGGNKLFGFYTLETKKPSPANATISVARDTGSPTKPYVVLNITPSPTAADQQRAIKGYEKFLKQQQKKKKKGQTTSPSPTPGK